MTPANRTHTLASLLADAAAADSFERAMSRHAAMNDALRADLFGIGAGKQAGFDRLDAMRARLLGETE